jgi:hypothetical protein
MTDVFDGIKGSHGKKNTESGMENFEHQNKNPIMSSNSINMVYIIVSATSLLLHS